MARFIVSLALVCVCMAFAWLPLYLVSFLVGPVGVLPA